MTSPGIESRSAWRRRALAAALAAVLLAGAAAAATELGHHPSLARRAAGPLQGTTALLLALPRALALIAARVGPPSATAAHCPGGGRFQVECWQEPLAAEPFLGPPRYLIDAVDCTVDGGGQSMRLNGSTRLTASRPGAACYGAEPGDFDMLVAIARFEIRGDAGTVLLTLDDLAGRLSFVGPGGPCEAEGIDVAVHGEATIDTDTAPQHPLHGAEFRIVDIRLRTAVSQRIDGCALSRYTTVVDGGMGLRTGDNVFAVLYDGFWLAADVAGGETQVALGGRLASDCLGGPIDVATSQAARMPEGEPCFKGGVLDLLYPAGPDRLRHTAAGGVDVDAGGDGVVERRFLRCAEPDLYSCPEG